MKDVIKTTVPRRPSNDQNRRTSQIQHKKKRRKNNFKLYYFMLFIVVSCAFVLLSLTVFFRADTISVTGKTLYTNDQIILASGLRKGDNLIRLNKDRVKNNILSQLANVDDVKIKKKFPSEIVIEVTAAKPYAVIEDNGLYYSISKTGKILGNSSENTDNLILIKGFSPEKLELNTYVKSKDDKKSELLKSISDNLDSQSFTGITEIDITERFDIKLKYQNRIDIALGGPAELAYKVKFAKVTIDEKIAENFTGNLIIRDNGGASIIPK